MNLRRHSIDARVARGTIADFAGTVLIASASTAVAFAVSATTGLLPWPTASPAGIVARRLRRCPGERDIVRPDY